MKKPLKNLLIIVAIAGIVGLTIYGTISLQSTINLTPVEFNPVHVKAFGYDVYNDDGDLLGSVDANTPAGHFIDANNLYPRVDAGHSEPYLVDAQGNPLGGEADLNPIQRFVVDGNVLFYHEMRYAVQFWARTYYNGGVFDDSVVSWLDPLHAQSYARGGGLSGSGTLDAYWTDATAQCNRLPRGSLAGLVDTGVDPWSGNFASGAAITCGIVPVDYVVGGTVIRPGYSFNEQMAKLTTERGNRKVIVRPWMDLAALSEYIQFTYTTEGYLPNGTYATITATESSGLAGFLSVVRTDNDSMKGAVPNYFPNNERAGMPLDSPDEGRSNTPQGAATPSSSGSGFTASGSLQYTAPGLDRTTTGAAQPLGISCPTLSGYIPSIRLSSTSMDTFSLPSEVHVVPGYVLQPITKIGVSVFSVSWGFIHFDNAWPYMYNTPWAASTTIEVPTSFESTNTYASSVATFRLGIITENEMQIVTSDGHTIDPSQFTDFELTSFVGDPNANRYSTTVSQTSPDVMSGVMNVLYVVLAIIIVIAVIFVISKIRRRKP